MFFFNSLNIALYATHFTSSECKFPVHVTECTVATRQTREAALPEAESCWDLGSRIGIPLRTRMCVHVYLRCIGKCLLWGGSLYKMSCQMANRFIVSEFILNLNRSEVLLRDN
jgi:hypothetical protein